MIISVVSYRNDGVPVSSPSLGVAYNGFVAFVSGLVRISRRSLVHYFGYVETLCKDVLLLSYWNWDLFLGELFTRIC